MSQEQHILIDDGTASEVFVNHSHLLLQNPYHPSPHISQMKKEAQSHSVNKSSQDSTSIWHMICVPLEAFLPHECGQLDLSWAVSGGKGKCLPVRKGRDNSVKTRLQAHFCINFLAGQSSLASVSIAQEDIAAALGI